MPAAISKFIGNAQANVCVYTMFLLHAVLNLEHAESCDRGKALGYMIFWFIFKATR
jgi:hypothetical protein